MTSFHLNYFLSPNSHTGGLGFQCMIWGGGCSMVRVHMHSVHNIQNSLRRHLCLRRGSQLSRRPLVSLTSLVFTPLCVSSHNKSRMAPWPIIKAVTLITVTINATIFSPSAVTQMPHQSHFHLGLLNPLGLSLFGSTTMLRAKIFRKLEQQETHTVCFLG